MPGVRGLLLAVALLSVPLSAQPPMSSVELERWLTLIGDRVEDYYSRAQSIVCLETVYLQSLGPDMAPDAPPRHLVYELRIAWEPAADGEAPRASVHRQLLKVGSRPARDGEEPGCTDPRAVSPEPLAMFLPDRRGDFSFAWAGMGRVDGRQAITLSYRAASGAEPSVTWEENCVSVDLPGMVRGRVWADTATGDVLRLDESLTGTFEFPVPRDLQRRTGAPSSLAIERADSSVRYRPVTFTAPDETVILPASIETLTVFRRTGIPRLRTTQVFSEYRRFLTEGRIVY